jgi:hypothetical protein
MSDTLREDLSLYSSDIADSFIEKYKFSRTLSAIDLLEVKCTLKTNLSVDNFVSRMNRVPMHDIDIGYDFETSNDGSVSEHFFFDGDMNSILSFESAWKDFHYMESDGITSDDPSVAEDSLKVMRRRQERKELARKNKCSESTEKCCVITLSSETSRDTTSEKEIESSVRDND